MHPIFTEDRIFGKIKAPGKTLQVYTAGTHQAAYPVRPAAIYYGSTAPRFARAAPDHP